MRIDPEVSRKKFTLEMQSIERNTKGLQERGCFIVRAEHPTIDAVFLPRNPLQILIPAVGSPADSGPLQAVIKGVTFHFLSARAFGVRIGLDDYDQRAPSVSFKDPWTWEPLSYAGNPRTFNAFYNSDTGQVASVLRPHPTTKEPFLCLQGTREYHEHPQHSGDDWMLYRGKMGVFILLTNILDTCIDPVVPALVLQGGAQGLMIAGTNATT